MGFIDRASSSFLPSYIPLKNVGSLLNAHITTTFCFHRCSRELSSLLIISSNSLSIMPVMHILVCGFLMGVAREYVGPQMGDHTNGNAEAGIDGQAGQPYVYMKPMYPSASAESYLNSDVHAPLAGQTGEGYGPIQVEE